MMDVDRLAFECATRLVGEDVHVAGQHQQARASVSATACKAPPRRAALSGDDGDVGKGISYNGPGAGIRMV